MKKKIIVIISLAFLLSGCWTTENGEKVGSIVKVSKEGAFISTWEAELIRGGMNGGSGGFGVKPFDFTIENVSLLEKVQFAMSTQKEVKIKYHKEFATLGRCESDNYFLDDIEIKEK